MAQERKTLVIVESPTKAETIRRYLAKDYVVMASKGHVRDLPEDRIGIDIEHGFEPEYVVTEGKGRLIEDLRKKLKGCDELLLATDEDREGESISWHLLELLRPSVPYRRMVFHEITRSAITEALKGGRDIDMNLVKAQEDRRIVDRLYGYEVSPVLWRKLSNKKLSGGRVQSVGLRFIVEKEMERLNYRSSSYYDVKADFPSFTAVLESVSGERVATGKDFDSITGAFDNRARLLSRGDCDAIMQWCKDHPEYEVTSVVMKPSVSNPQPPFTTSTLQQAASSRLHLSSRETMRIAQSLFENGFITYMRTDSVNLSKECIDAARSQIENEFGAEYLSEKVRTFRNRSKNAQEAHEAIRPAGDTFRRPEQTGLKGKDLALYTLIWMRTIATQMASARKSTTTVKIVNGEYVFSSSGTVVLFPGYLKVYSDDRDEDEKLQSLPSLKEGDRLSDAVLSASEHVTTPPSRYSEASLIRKLEEQGIGRPSTYATIISTLLDRGYVREQDRAMIPTFTGFAVNACMNSTFSQLVDYSYTSDMEDELDRVAQGKEDSLVYLNTFYYGDGEGKGLKAMVEEAKASQADYKTLHLPNFSGSVTLRDGRVCTYSVKIGPYGAYLATDLRKDDGKALLVNIPSYELPGLMDDDDIRTLVEDAVFGGDDVQDDRIVLKKGQRGEYWQKGDQRCSVPRGRKKAEDYSQEEIEYMFSLPRTVATDEDGNEVVLNKGPYGFYLKYRDANYKVFSVPFNMTGDEALALVGSKKPSTASSLKGFDDYEGLPLTIRKGRYGAYLKWGSTNIRLPRNDVESFTQEEVEQLCRASVAANSAKGGAVIGSWEGGDVTLHDGRYGQYVKWNDTNYRLPRGFGEVTLDKVVALITQARSDAPVSLGDHEGRPVLIANGRYGAYLKWGDENFRLPRSVDTSSLTLDDAIGFIRTQSEQKAIRPVVLGQSEGKDVVVAHGRYGYYLKWDGSNIALPMKYRNDISSLTLEQAVDLIRRKKGEA